MGSDCALYVRVKDRDELRRLLPQRFAAVEHADTCEFGRVADAEWSAERLATLASRLSGQGHDALVMAYASVTNAFWFARFQGGGAAVRLLDYTDGWRTVRGTPEPWEHELAELPEAGAEDLDFDAWTACDLIGDHYHLTGWYESEPGPPVRQSVRELVLHGRLDQAVDRTVEQVKHPRSLDEAIHGAHFGIAVPRALFLGHPLYFVPVDGTGVPSVRDGALLVFTTRADLDAYLASAEAPLFEVRSSLRLTGAEVLALAPQVRARMLRLNHYGVGATARLDVVTLAPTGSPSAS